MKKSIVSLSTDWFLSSKVSYLIYDYLVTSPPEYDDEKIRSIMDSAVDFIQPIINHPVDEVALFNSFYIQISEGTVMVSCTLNAIPSFLPIVVPHIPVYLSFLLLMIRRG